MNSLFQNTTTLKILCMQLYGGKGMQSVLLRDRQQQRKGKK